MKKLKGTQTEKNLWAAFAGESQARNKYEFFAKEFKKAGYEQIAAIFQETANNEKEHAKREFKYLVKLGDLKSHLKAAIDGEHYEQTKMYPDFAKTARKEGLDKIAGVFEAIAVAEKQHEKRYNELRANILESIVFKRKAPVVWRCRNCGYIYEGLEAPALCPACAHSQAYFELLGENW